MIVGVVTIDLYIPQSSSLKDKRSVMKSLKQKIRNNFNVSVAETDHQDKWQRAELGISIIQGNRSNLDAVLSRLEAFVTQDYRVTVSRWDMRIV